MAKPYLVELVVTAVVMADDADDALAVANSCAVDICHDDRPKARRVEPVTSLDDLRDGWDGRCIPYNHDGQTRLLSILS